MSRPEHGQHVDEAIVMPDLPVIDAHIHLWTRDNFFAADMVDDAASGHDVRSTVYVECSMAYSDDPRPGYDAVGETEFVLDQVGEAAGAPHDLAAGILGAADLTMGDAVRGVLEAHVAAGQGRFRGVRYRPAWDADPIAGYGEVGYPGAGVLTDPAVCDAAVCMADMGLVLDLWGFHTQLHDMARLAEQVPSLPVVIDHVGGPLGVGRYAGQREAVLAEWRDGLRELAQLPNVHIKLSGLAIWRLGFGFQDRGQAGSSDELVALWQPYIDTCVDLFGPDRSIFSSNYPVDRAAAPYPVLLNAYKKMLAHRSRNDLEAIFAGNAQRIYGLN